MKRSLICLLAALLCLSLLSGCQRAANSEPERPEITPKPTAAPAEPPPAETPDPTPEMVRVLTAPVEELDPAAIQEGGANCLLEIYEPLMGVLAETGESGESFEHQAGSAVYTFHLRSGITDHDGNALTAGDAVFCYTRLAERRGGAWPLFSRAEAAGEDQLNLVFTRELTGAGELEKYVEGVYLYTQKAYEEHNGFADSACGTGPYILSEFTPGEGLLAVRNENYWAGEENDARAPRSTANVMSIQYLFVPSGAAQVIALETGRADMSDGLDYSDTVDFRDGGIYTDQFRTERVWAGENNILVPNVSWQSIMKEQNMRLGVFYAIDNAELARSFGEDCARACRAPGNPDYPDCLESWSELENCQNLALDVDSVRSYLRQAGYVNESFVLLVTEDTDAAVLAGRIQTLLRPMSITVYVVAVDAETFQQRLKDESAWDLAIVTLEAESSITEIWKQLWTDRLAANAGLGGLRDSAFLNLLNAVNTAEGCTEENLTAVVRYAAEHAYGMGLVQKSRAVVAGASLREIYLTERGELLPGACIYG